MYWGMITNVWVLTSFHLLSCTYTLIMLLLSLVTGVTLSVLMKFGFYYYYYYYYYWGQNSSVGIATSYGLDGPGIESRWVRDFLHPFRPLWGPPSLLCNGYWVFSGG
jgi:hypothetical protein